MHVTLLCTTTCLHLACTSLSARRAADGGGGSNALIMPANKPGNAGSAGEQQLQQQAPLSKSQLKKLKQVQMKKERREQLSEVGGRVCTSTHHRSVC
jgi:hypothetical protein